MKRKITLLLFVLSGICLAHAQQVVHQVIILNEGHYDYALQTQTIPVTIGSYNPVTHVYSSFDTIRNARFASHVIVDGNIIYAAADSQLISYDADSHQLLHSVIVPGIRKLSVWNNQLLVSRGEYLRTFNSYFQVYDKTTLSFLYDLPVGSGPQYASEGIVVKNDIAYLAINNGFDWGHEVGFIGCIDLNNQQYLNEISLGNAGKNPENIILDNNDIYTVNNTDYTTASISHVDVTSQAVNTVNLNTTTGCGASGYSPGTILFQVSGEDRLRRFNTGLFHVQDTLQINRNIYGMATDEVNNLIYIGETDYTSYGRVFIHDFSGAAVDSFEVSVSPGNIAMDVRSTAGVRELSSGGNSLLSYPNPAHDFITIDKGKTISSENFILSDVTGRTLMTINSREPLMKISLVGIGPGVYILSSAGNKACSVKIVKQ